MRVREQVARSESIERVSLSPDSHRRDEVRRCPTRSKPTVDLGVAFVPRRLGNACCTDDNIVIELRKRGVVCDAFTFASNCAVLDQSA